jgi:hypothetical protein
MSKNKLYTYYIFMPGDDMNDINDSNILGEESLHNNFWPGDGFRALTNIINKAPHVIESLKIMRSDGKEITLEKFLESIKKFNIKK